jgi:hypothetical protein
MLRTHFVLFVALLIAAPTLAADGKTAKVQPGSNPPPKELKDSISQLLSDKTAQVVDDKGNAIAEIWFRKEIPSKADPKDIQQGARYRHVEQSTLMGAIKLGQLWNDFRGQRIKPGVYTLRMALQPMDGDHMGTAPFNEFCLLIPANLDEKPDPMEFKHMFELSCKAAGSSHGAMMLLYPNDKPGEAPELVNKGGGNYILSWKGTITAGGQKGTLGLGLTLFGRTTAE